MEFAKLAASRSTCIRRKVGCVLVKDNHIISTGYNGSPCGFSHCEETGCLREKLNVPSGERSEICRGLHAEWNAIIHATTNIQGSALYTTTFPCIICAKMLINADIDYIVYLDDYNDKWSKMFLKEARIDTYLLDYLNKENA